MSTDKQLEYYIGSIKFFRLKLLALSNSEIESYVKSLENLQKEIKDEIFRISWHMRGGVSSHDLFHTYSFEDRKIITEIIKDNIETVKKTQLALL